MTYYSIKPEERKVTAYLVIKDGSSYDTFEGVSKCSPDDKFDPEIGKKIARLRAMIKFKKTQLAFHKFQYVQSEEAYRRHMYHLDRCAYTSGKIMQMESELENIIKSY